MKKSTLIKIVIIFLFGFNLFNCQKKVTLGYQNDELIQNLGIGLIQVVNPNKKLILYSDSNLSKIKLVTNPIPLLNKPDYNILFFISLEKKSNFYKIAISKNDYAYLKESQDFIYYDWKSFLKEQIVGIESKNIKTNPPRTSINGKVINIKSWKPDDEIEIIKVENDWLQIKNITQNNQIFWIQWKDDKQLKVYLNLLV